MIAGARGIRYLLDTNILIYIAKGQPQTVRERFVQHPAAELAMSVITLGELLFRAEKSQARLQALETVQQLQTMMQVCALSDTAAAHYGEIRAGLQKMGRPIGGNDLWMAAHARAEGWTLVSNNLNEFARVPGLDFENWAEAHRY